MKKICIALKGTGGCGKSTTVISLANELKNKGAKVIVPQAPRPNKFDIQEVIEFKGKKIGIESEGDPNTDLKKRLDQLVMQKCDIILCACRSYGYTNDEVRLSCKNYEIIWLNQIKLDSSFDEKDLQDAANNSVVKLIIDIINKYTS